MKVYKYKIEPDEDFELDLPKDAQVLTCGHQEGFGYFLWALVDPEAPTQTRKFRWAGTGQEITEPRENLRYVCTFMVDPFVWHIFEVLG